MFGVDLSGQIAWVTGGSRGIGREISLALAEAGCDVAIGYRSQESQAREVAEQIQAKGRRALILQGDVADPTSCEETHKKIVEELGAVDILVNNAGVIRDNLFIQLTVDDWETVLKTNLMGAVHTCKAVTRGMMQKRKGRIINMSSVAASKSGRGQANYAASKNAVEAFSKSLACELGKRNITVNCIAPGVIETDMTQEVVRLGKDKILERQLVKRLGRPEEIAAWVVFVASDYGAFMTGEVVHVDGGLKMD